MSVKLPDLNPILLPQVPKWEDAEDVARYAAMCLDATALMDWEFGWDKTIRRMGCCKPVRKRISLSSYFVEKFMKENPAQVRRTLLHELAHALAWEFNQTSGHGATWHLFCAKLGIADEKARTVCPSFAPETRKQRPPLYVLCHKGTGAIYHYYRSKPRSAIRNIKNLYIAGKKAETLGKLMIRPFDASKDRV